MNKWFLFSLILMIIGCSPEQPRLSFEEPLFKYLDNKKIDYTDRIVILLLGDQCEPCVTTTAAIVDKLGHSKANLNTKKTIICVYCDQKEVSNYNRLGYSVHRLPIEESNRAGLTSNKNYILDIRKNGDVKNWWIFAIETNNDILKHFNLYQ